MASPSDTVEQSTLECYICCDASPDKGALVSVCKCTDRVMHIECQRTLIASTTKSIVCPVCTATYTNAELTLGRPKLTHDGRIMAALTVGALALAGIGLDQILVWKQYLSGGCFISIAACYLLVAPWLGKRAGTLTVRQKRVVLRAESSAPAATRV